MKHVLLVSCCVVIGMFSAPQAFSGGFLDHSSVSQNTLYNLVSEDAASEAAEKFITNLTSQGIGFLGDSSLSASKQKKEFQKLLNTNFDLNTIGRFSLGRHWRSASKAERDEYLKLFKVMIIDVYSGRFSDYKGQEIKVIGSRKEGERDVLVHSILDQKNGPNVKVDWRVRKRDGQHSVIDVIVEGVSLALTQRSDFSSVVQRGGGNIEALLVHLRAN